MNNFREGPMTPLQMLKTVAGICKTNGKMDWDNNGQTPKKDFIFITGLCKSYLVLCKIMFFQI